MRIEIKVIPKNSRARLIFDGNRLKAYLNSPPADGRANEELVRRLAEKFGVSKSEIEIVRGKSSQNKIVDIMGVSEEEIRKALR
jgi:uncharacterized protein (TIGR00251 family)